VTGNAYHLAPKLLSWASILEAQAQEQAIQSSKLPFIYPHVALMPDAHFGMGATVGSVIPTVDAIIPAAVGVDIGCGMIAARTSTHVDDILDGDFADLRQRIEAIIPLSAGRYNKGFDSAATIRRIEELVDLARASRFNPEDYAANWTLQLGSLGSGNHFIEVSFDEEGAIWLFLHSGSRGVGNKIAQRHIKIAKQLNPHGDLSWLEEGTEEFDRYIREMQWAQAFALANREEMMDRVWRVYTEWLGVDQIFERDRINTHHNYTQPETHYETEVWLSRKGAIDAHEGVKGLIPGSMGAASYVVVGLGNEMALHSAPHGAGRQHSRGSAKRTFNLEGLRDSMTGIEWRDSASFLDEHPEAYKPIDVVMYDARDLVTIRHTLRQLVNVKGE